MEKVILELIKVLYKFYPKLPTQDQFVNFPACRERNQNLINLFSKRVIYCLRELQNQICWAETENIYSSEFNSKINCRLLRNELKIEIDCTSIRLYCLPLIKSKNDSYLLFGQFGLAELFPIFNNPLEQKLRSFMKNRAKTKFDFMH